MLCTTAWRCTQYKVVWSKYLHQCFSTFARAEICEFDAFPRDQHIFRLDVTVEDALAMDVLNRFEQLVHVHLYLLRMQVLVPHQAFIEILLHQFEDQRELA